MKEPVQRGKVREIYEVSKDRLAIVTTDRISAFDSVLPVEIPGKGIVLNQLSNFWFEKTRHIVQNHLAREELPAEFQTEAFKDRTVLVERLKMLPYEFIMRGYLFGSMWSTYKEGKDFCGVRLEGEYQQAEKLKAPILTPAIKHDDTHDEYISLDGLRKGLGAELAGKIEKICFALYETCAAHALKKGLIIADAKFEFGLNSLGELVLGDELFTPDSSRFWAADAYVPGTSPKSYDKQVLRDWLTAHGMRFDAVPREVLEQTARIYRECLRRITE